MLSRSCEYGFKALSGDRGVGNKMDVHLVIFGVESGARIERTATQPNLAESEDVVQK